MIRIAMQLCIIFLLFVEHGGAQKEELLVKTREMGGKFSNMIILIG